MTDAATPRHRLAVVVLDGLDWEWTLAHPEEAPELWAMASAGCYAPLRCPSPPLTPTSVAALLCGRLPPAGWSGDGGSYTSSADLLRRDPWPRRLARDEGLRVGWCNVPVTWPAFPPGPGCWLVSGWPMSGSRREGDLLPRQWVEPGSLEVSVVAGGYPIGVIADDCGPGGTKDLAGLAAAEQQIATWCATEAPPTDLLVCWLRATDGAGHHAWGTPTYAEIVATASRSAAIVAASSRTCLVISDHGFDALDSPRCEAYRSSGHGPVAADAGLRGGHAEVGVLFASGAGIHARCLLPEQRLIEVAAGLCGVLQVPAPAGVTPAAPAWAAATSADEDSEIRERLRALGYVS